MQRKRTTGLSISSQTLAFVDGYAQSHETSRSNAIEQLIWLAQENISTISHIEKDLKMTVDKLENRVKNEVNRLAKLQIHQIRLAAATKGFILFQLDNTLHVDANIVKTIEEKSIQKIMEVLKNGE